MAGQVIIVVEDLLFQSRISETAAALGLQVVIADTPERIARTSFDGSVVVLDLQCGHDPRSVISRGKAAGARVLAFGRHTDAASLRHARDAGADRVVVRSDVAERLPQLLRSLAESPAEHGRA